MKFAQKDILVKEAFGMKIDEYCESRNPFPIDCAVAHFRNSQYPWKINHGFYETFFVLEGECCIEFEDKTVTLSKHDFFVIEPEKKHTSRAQFADVLINCTPPFDIKNVEFCNILTSISKQDSQRQIQLTNAILLCKRFRQRKNCCAGDAKLRH